MVIVCKDLYHPIMGYTSQLKEGRRSTYTAPLVRAESQAVRLISSPPLIYWIPPHVSCSIVTSFSIFYRYFQANCSFELGNCIPIPSLAAVSLHKNFTEACSYAVLNFIATCKPPPLPAASLHKTYSLSWPLCNYPNSLSESISSISLSRPSLVNSKITFLYLYFLLPTYFTRSRRGP